MEKTRTLDVQIIELADDIAYAVHDLEDGIALNLFSVEEIIFELQKAGLKDIKTFKDLYENALEYSGIILDSNNCRGPQSTMQEFSQLMRKKLCSALVNCFINGISFEKVGANKAKKCGINPENNELSLGKNAQLCTLLGETTLKCALQKKDIAVYERRGGLLLSRLYNLFANIDANKEWRLLPPSFRKVDSKIFKKQKEVTGKDLGLQKVQLRAIIDYLAGMMDTYAISVYEQFFNESFDNILLVTKGFFDDEKQKQKQKNEDAPNEGNMEQTKQSPLKPKREDSTMDAASSSDVPEKS